MACNLRINDYIISDVSLAVFDKDGTLIDVHTYWTNMVKFRAESVARKLCLGEKETVGLMNSMGVDTDLWKIKPEGPVGIKKREIVLHAGVEYLLALGMPDHTNLFEEAFSEVDEKSIDYFHEIIKPLDGLHELFECLRKHSCLIAVATADRTERARLAMRHVGVEDSIDLIVGADLVKKSKPATDMADFVISRLGIPRKASVMVGDAVSDVRMGLNSRFRASIGVASGSTSPERLLEVTPFVVPSIADISISRHLNNQ
jgi:phosphoglycolate phosphatase